MRCWHTGSKQIFVSLMQTSVLRLHLLHERERVRPGGSGVRVGFWEWGFGGWIVWWEACWMEWENLFGWSLSITFIYDMKTTSHCTHPARFNHPPLQIPPFLHISYLPPLIPTPFFLPLPNSHPQTDPQQGITYIWHNQSETPTTLPQSTNSRKPQEQTW